MQDYDLVRLEGFEGHIYKVIWPKGLKVLMGIGLCFCAISYCIIWVKGNVKCFCFKLKIELNIDKIECKI